MNTPIRRLEGITYWVIEDATAIADFMNTNIRKEWEGDARSESRDPNSDPLLQSLSQYHWSLEIIPTERVTTNPKIMNYIDEKSGYVFSEALVKRSEALQRSIEKYASVMWPVIISKDDYLLLDGYCRFTTLRNMKIPNIYAYVGEGQPIE